MKSRRECDRSLPKPHPIGFRPKRDRRPRARSWRDTIKVHPACELFPRMSADELRELGEDIKKNGMIMPIIIYAEPSPDPDRNWFAKDYSLLDGISRLDAMESVGIRPLLVQETGKDGSNWCWSFPLDEDWEFSRWTPKPYVIHQSNHDPCDWVISANIHRRHLKPEDRLRLVKKLIKLKPELSSRQIAQKAQVSPTTAAKVRKELEAAGDVSTLDTLTDSKGRQQPARKTRSQNGATVELPAASEAITVSEDSYRNGAGEIVGADRIIDLISELFALTDHYEPQDAIHAKVHALQSHGSGPPWPPPFSERRVHQVNGWLARFGELWRKVERDHKAILSEERRRYEAKRASWEAARGATDAR
jgi:DNA-binding transcriptional regulator YhcF (GntR family)